MPVPRRVRCPTCKAGLAEPATSTLVYRCPFCSTLLQAKGAAAPPTNDCGRTDDRIHPIPQGGSDSTAMERATSTASSSRESSNFSSSNSSVSDKTMRILAGDDDDSISSSTFSVDDQPQHSTRLKSSSAPKTHLSKSESPHSVSVPSYDGAEAESQCEECSLITNRSEEQPRDEDLVGRASLVDLIPARATFADDRIDSPPTEETSIARTIKGEARHEWKNPLFQSPSDSGVVSKSSTKLGWHTRESKAGHSDATRVQEERRIQPAHIQESKFANGNKDHLISTTSDGGSAPQVESDERTTLDFDLYGEYEQPEPDMYAPPLRIQLQEQQPQSIVDNPSTETVTDIYRPPRRKQIHEPRSKLDNQLEEKRELHSPANAQLLSSRFQVGGADQRWNLQSGIGSKFRGNPEGQLDAESDAYVIRRGTNPSRKVHLPRASDSSGSLPPRHRLHHPENFDLELMRYREWAEAQNHVRHSRKIQNDGEKRRNSFDQNRTSREAICSSISHRHLPGVPPAQSVAPWMFDHQIDSCSHHSVHPVCAFCIQQSYLTHHPLLHAHLQPHCATCSLMANTPHHTHVSPHFGTQLAVEYGSKQPEQQEDSDVIFPSRSKNQVKFRKQKRFPPFPIGSAAPYVLCQHCAKLLQVPACLPPTDGISTQKLRCGSCSKVSNFSIRPVGSPHSSLPSSENPSRLSTNDTLPRLMIANDQKSVRSDSREAPRSSTLQVSNPWKGDHDNASQRPQGENGMNYRRSNASEADARITPIEASSNWANANAEISQGPNRERVSFSAERVHDTGASLQNGALRRLGSKDKREADAAVGSRAGYPNTNTSLRENGASKSPLAQGSELRNGDSQVEIAADAQLRSSSSAVAQRGDDQCVELPAPLETAVPGSPLHEHFGYRTPSELLQRYFSYRDAQTDGPSANHTQFSARPSNASSDSMAKHAFRPSSPLRAKFWKPSQTGEAPRASIDGQLWSEGSRFEEQVSLYPGHNHNSSQYRNVETVAKRGFINSGERKFAGFLKRSLKDLAGKGSLLTGNSRQRVIINGHAVPASAIKKAEEHAGKLHPGSYWYDYKAGFWGVSGGPCIGIIPPFIEHLNYPMARDCANGNTLIFVNGRELHQKDLKVLAHRGLPMEPGKAYSVEFDGTVIDEAGQQLKGLGKLAPTVERLGKGFGMSRAKADQI